MGKRETKAKGKVKAGFGGLVGNAGEFYVVAELLKRGVVAALAPRNARAFDVLATRGHHAVRIRVKTKSGQYDPWQWVAKKSGDIFLELSKESDFTVLVNLTEDRSDMRFYVVPTHMIHDWLCEDFATWCKTPGKGGRPHDSTTNQRHLSFKKFEPQLEQYREKWDVLWPVALSG
jgi:hypothetical protein